MNKEKIASQFNDAAEKYDSQRKLFIPCFDDYYGMVKNFLQSKRISVSSVLDLGAGTGLLTKYVKEVFPNANYKLIDLSEKMLQIAKNRFVNCPNVEYELNDYITYFPSGSFDLIISALSIHHFEDDKKRDLYRNVYEHLNESGCLINVDQFNADSLEINNLYINWWYEYISNSGIDQQDKKLWLQRRVLDNENSIFESVQMLRKLGFKNAECIYQFMKFGVIVASK